MNRVINGITVKDFVRLMREATGEPVMEHNLTILKDSDGGICDTIDADAVQVAVSLCVYVHIYGSELPNALNNTYYRVDIITKEVTRLQQKPLGWF